MRRVGYDSWADHNRNGKTYPIFPNACWHAQGEYESELYFAEYIKKFANVWGHITSMAMQKMFYTKQL